MRPDSSNREAVTQASRLSATRMAAERWRHAIEEAARTGVPTAARGVD
ncbi:MAG: hypothetical protein VX431_02390 [Planctomycetota bacterium]|nr:hypothetical protein [Planctomycetota bacterium]